MAITCTVGGMVPTVAAMRSYPLPEELFLLGIAWIWHWAIAGIMIWGLFGMLVPVWCMYQLLHGLRNPWSVLSIALLAQLVVSTVAVCSVAYDEERMRPVFASGVVALLVLVRWALSSHRSFKEEENSRAEVDAPAHEWVVPEASSSWQRRKR